VPLAERWVGRLASAGFAIGLAEEMITGLPILEQIGFATPDDRVFAALAGAMLAGVALGTVDAIRRAEKGTMSRGEFSAYSGFLGADGDADAASAARALKLAGDFTSPDNLADVRNAKVGGTPADAVLAPTDASEALRAAAAAAKAAQARDNTAAAEAGAAAAANAALKASERAAWDGDVAPTAVLLPDEDPASLLAYQREVEMQNGRAAMLGFAAAVLIEAHTGYGIIPQLITYGKLSGILGADSGF